MKKIKKIFALCLILVLAMGIFTGCGSSTDLSSSPYCGDWIAVYAESDGIKVPVDLIDFEGSLSLKTNGEAILRMSDPKMEGKFKWKEIGNGILLEDFGEKVALIWEDGYLTLAYTDEGETYTVYLEKY